MATAAIKHNFLAFPLDWGAVPPTLILSFILLLQPTDLVHLLPGVDCPLDLPSTDPPLDLTVPDVEGNL